MANPLRRAAFTASLPAPQVVCLRCPACRRQAMVALPLEWRAVNLAGWRCECGGALEVRRAAGPGGRPV